MSCPACGVPVVPGYARCPKCHKPLPQRAATHVEGGTSLEPERPRVPPAVFIGVGVVGVALILWLGLRHTDKPAPKVVAVQPQVQPVAPQQNFAPAAPEAPSQPKGPSAEAVASDLQSALRRQRLWSTVTVIGARVDVRSGSCSDPAMKPAIDGAAPQFKSAGLSTLRCVEESGAVVFTRAL